MSQSTNRITAAVLTLGLTIAALTFFVGMVQTSRQIDTPMPFVGLVFGGLMFGALWLGPVGRAIGRMLDSKAGPDDQTLQQFDQLEARLVDAGVDQQRLMELEDRVEFAERMLAQRQAPELPRHRTPV
jgi:hypothetical protein